MRNVKKFKVIIAGGREFNDYNKLKKVCDYMLQNTIEVEVVSGCARGADRLGERYAKENGYKIHRFPADWDKHGKKAGYMRNKQMADFGDVLIAFWDGHSLGTRNMIDLAKNRNRPTHVESY